MFNDIGPEGGELIAKALHVSIRIPQTNVLFGNFNFFSFSLEPTETNVNVNLF